MVKSTTFPHFLPLLCNNVCFFSHFRKQKTRFEANRDDYQRITDGEAGILWIGRITGCGSLYQNVDYRRKFIGIKQLPHNNGLFFPFNGKGYKLFE